MADVFSVESRYAQLAAQQERKVPQAPEAERAVLGACLLRPDLIQHIAKVIGPGDFFGEANARVFAAILALHGKEQPVDSVTVWEVLSRIGGVEAEHVLALTEIIPVFEHCVEHATLVREKALARKLIEACTMVLVNGYSGEMGGQDLLDGASRALSGILQEKVRRQNKRRLRPAGAVARRAVERFSAAPSERIHLGLPKLSNAVGYVPAGSLIVVGADTGVGKALRSTEPVLTPKGWAHIGELQAGEEVFSAGGNRTTVLGVFPQGKRALYRVQFDDGASVDADLDHLWEVTTDLRLSRGQPWLTMTTREIMERGLHDPGGRSRWRIPVCGAIQHDQANLLVDPYLMGVLLGDGCFRSASITLAKSGDPDSLARCEAALPSPVRLRRQPGEREQYRLTCEKPGRPVNSLLESIKIYGLHGLGSSDKFIPRPYLHASIEQRMALLHGIMDTDGTVSKDGRCVQYCTVSQALRDDVAELVRSLGGLVRITSKIPIYVYDGERRTGNRAYTITMSTPVGLVPFFCKRKREKWKPREKYQPCRKIVSIAEVGVGDATCIIVDDPSATFITKDHIVTHNSSFCLELAYACATHEFPIKTATISLEDPEELLGGRLLAVQSGLSSRVMQRGIADDTGWGVVNDSLVRLDRQGDAMQFAELINGYDSEVMEVMTEAAESGAKIVIVDYLTAIKTRSRSHDKRTEMTDILGRLKEHAVRLGVVLVLVSQISRPQGGNPNWRPTKHSLKETGELENMAEVILLLWREEENDFSPIHVEAAKIKWGGTGQSWIMQREKAIGAGHGSARLREAEPQLRLVVGYKED